MQWPTQPRNLIYIFPLKTSLEMQKMSVTFFLLQKLYKKACLKSQNCAYTNRHTHTHISGSKNLRYVVGKAQGKAGKRRYGGLSRGRCGMLE